MQTLKLTYKLDLRLTGVLDGAIAERAGRQDNLIVYSLGTQIFFVLLVPPQ